MENLTKISGLINEINTSYTYVGRDGQQIKFMQIMLEIPRLSDNTDTVPIIISEKLLNTVKVGVNDLISITGEIRTRNFEDEDGRKHLSVYCYANDIEAITVDQFDEIQDKNVVKLEGFLCKEPVHRKTAVNGRIITDLLVAHNKGNSHHPRSSYIPCIAWGINAKLAKKQLHTGDRIVIEGRFQSRVYRRKDDYLNRDFVAYEVSIHNFEKCTDDGPTNAADDNAAMIA